jgi:Bacterial pre-peptidase C-terminal domain
MFDTTSGNPRSTGLDTSLTTVLPNHQSVLSTSTGGDRLAPGSSSANYISTLDVGNPTLIDTGSLNGRRVFNGIVAGNGNGVVYQFTVDATTNLSLTLNGTGGDVDLYLFRAGSNNPIQVSALDGNQESFTLTGLAAGTYYADVFQYGVGNTNYNLSITSDTAGESLLTARNLGGLNGSTTLRDFVGSDDRLDFYRLQLTDNSNTLNVGLRDLSADADVSLIRDFNNNGLIDDGEIVAQSVNSGTNPESLNLQNLGAGTYYLRVNQYTGDTNYALDISATSVAPPVTSVTIPFNAIDLGALQGRVSVSDSVNGSNNVNDFYRFTLTNTSDVSLSLTGSGTDIDLYLARDFNNDGQIDGSEIIRYSATLSNQESFTATGLTAGTYYAIAEIDGSGSNSYTLTATSDAAGSNFKDARNLGVVNGSVTVRDFVGTSDPRDIYRFQLNSNNDTIALALTGLTADADIYISRDANNNGVYDPGEAIGYAYSPGTTSDITYLQGMLPGTYYVQVVQYRGDTNYTLGISTSLGNSNNSPADIGPLNTWRSVSGTLTANDAIDYYHFSLAATTNLTLNASGLTNRANVLVIQDANNDGIWNSGDFVRQTISSDGTVNLSGLGAGNYFLGTFRTGGDTSYTLQLSSDAAGNSLFSSRNLGSLTGNRSFADLINASDPVDYYRFTLNTTSTVNIYLGGLADDLDLALIQDTNGNGVVDSGDTLQQSLNAGTQADTISRTLAPGTYYVQVRQGSNISNSAYKIDFSAIPLT